MKRGSALLIVLGMLSFMVISAVAFSMFMRQSRLPSSFVRQRILARQLVKAGLAQAMSEIDRSIGSAAYPGVGATGGGAQQSGSGTDSNLNYWKNRVFMLAQAGVTGTYGAYWDAESESYRAYGDTDEQAGLPQEKTVSTLPIEGLAYLPPPLVNTVRYWSRHTPTAQWQNLDYDSGRFAYTAVNVSDYLDINRLKANVMRDSSPSNRISLAFLFENPEHTDWDEVTPKKFDDAMKNLNQDAARGRLVSLADYNMAVGGGQLNGIGFKSPFYDYFQGGGGGDGSFYGSNEDQARRQKFITDSWYPGTNTTELFLSDYEVPLHNGGGKGIRDKGVGLLPLMQNDGVSPIFDKVKSHLNLAERAALRDYVDEDNVPSSLALPTLERTPLLTGLFVQLLPGAFVPEILPVTDEPKVEMADNDTKKITHYAWKVAGFKNLSAVVKGSAVYPFKRSSGMSTTPDFDVQVLIKAYLVEKDRVFDRTRETSGQHVFRPADKGDWQTDSDRLGVVNRGYISLLATRTAKLSEVPRSENGALIDIDSVTVSGNPLFERFVYGYKTVEKKVDDASPQGYHWEAVPDECGYDTSRVKEVVNGLTFYYLDKDDKLREVIGNENIALKWQLFAWVRILDKAGNTVDMFPATVRDDDVYNGINGNVPQLVATQAGIDSVNDPIVTFPGPQAFNLTGGKDFKNDVGTEDTSKALCCYCNDPRYNWAPEDWWFVENGTGVSADEWFKQTKSYRDGLEYRQNDLFQFVSNQGYLQSVGEFQFLPLVRRENVNNTYGDYTEDSPIQGGIFLNGSQYSDEKAIFRTSPGDAANQACMWKMRWAFGEYADWDKGGDLQDSYRWGIADRRGGAAVNPYADKDLFMAALANTPYDYIVAAEMENPEDQKLEDNIDLCFNARSEEAKMDWQTLQDVASALKVKFQSTDESWEEWDGWDQLNFLGVAGLMRPGDVQEGLHDVDRKFLFSYWKQCFANSQQLFLVFVRAEPTVVGGDGGGHTPSQLGARAVALVWREPTSSLSAMNGEANPPHRMRILFYHQFE